MKTDAKTTMLYIPPLIIISIEPTNSFFVLKKYRLGIDYRSLTYEKIGDLLRFCGDFSLKILRHTWYVGAEFLEEKRPKDK